ncbi:type 2 periplasmic-binding domain-containing protein [Frigidibacter oleivorans]|uniref:4,5-dihydroxyphthalate decarboxylase n=1 Tax=Frigidibacter oleivorans TaxID=2487129 RepID=UPI000F8C6158|nr:4,5-dihydroxyphthalate decarboxylase [Frigidibacter oleivorans]
MTRLKMTMAISDYAHTVDLVAGRIQPVGIALNILSYSFERVGLRFAQSREFDIAEFSFAGYCAHLANSDRPDLVAFPVFPSRVFRQSAFYVNGESGIADVGDLAGKRIGLPQWSQTATVYAKGYLQHQAKVPLDSVDWVQAGVNSPGRKEGVALRLPAGVKLRTEPARSLSDMLACGDLDAVISARPPDSYLQGHPSVRRLFADPRAAEEAYFRQTGIFPIMHIMVVRRDLFEANRWILRNLMDAFEEAKRNALRAMDEITTSYLPIAWGPEEMRRLNSVVFGDGEIWPYGLTRNRATIDAFLGYCHEQGVTHRRLAPEDLFPQECLQDVVI